MECGRPLWPLLPQLSLVYLQYGQSQCLRPLEHTHLINSDIFIELNITPLIFCIMLSWWETMSGYYHTSSADDFKDHVRTLSFSEKIKRTPSHFAIFWERWHTQGFHRVKLMAKRKPLTLHMTQAMYCIISTSIWAVTKDHTTTEVDNWIQCVMKW